VVALLAHAGHGIDVAEAKVLLGEAEIVRQLLARRLLHDARGPVNAISAPGSAIVTVRRGTRTRRARRPWSDAPSR